MAIHACRKSVLLFLLCFVFCGILQAANLVSVREILLFENGKSDYGLRLSGGELTENKADGFKAIRLEVDKDNRHFAVDFDNGQLLKLKQHKVWDGKAIRVVIRSDKDASANLAFSWKRADGKAAGKLIAVCELKKNYWKEVIIPLDKSPRSIEVAGFTLHCDAPGAYDVRSVEFCAMRSVMVNPLAEDALFDSSSVRVSGRVATDVKDVRLIVKSTDALGRQSIRREEVLAIVIGGFSLELKKSELSAGCMHEVIPYAQKNDGVISVGAATTLFGYPELTGKKLPALEVKEGGAFLGGKPFAFSGAVFDGFGRCCGMADDYSRLAMVVEAMADLKISAVRIPVAAKFVDGVLPDNPKWKEVCGQNNSDPEFWGKLDYFVAYAGQRGIYSIITLGACEQVKDAKDMQASSGSQMLEVGKWLSRHFEGDANVLGIVASNDEKSSDKTAVKILSLLKPSVFMVKDAKKEELRELCGFLRRCGVYASKSVGPELHLLYAPERFAVYGERGEPVAGKVYPAIVRKGEFRIVNEAGKTVFAGDTGKLSKEGFVPKLQDSGCAVFEICK